MAGEAAKTDETAEKAFAAAVEAVAAKPEVVAKPRVKKAKAPAKPKPALKAKTNSKPKPVRKVAKPAASKTPQPKPVTQVKETLMAKTPDFMASFTDAMAEMQDRAKAAYEKSTEFSGEATEFAKGNVEAMVESGKILAAGAQDLGKAYVEEAKGAFETATADLKEIAAIKSPTELFQLQGKLMRRNFDAMIAFGSKSSETMVKLANDSMAPLSSRMSVAADKLSKVA